MGAAARVAAELEPDSALGLALAEGHTVDSRLLTRLAQEGDAGAIAVLERAGEYLGAGLVTLSNIFDPELVVIGGGAAAAGELLFAPARRVLTARASAAGARPRAHRAGGARSRRRLHRRGGAGADGALSGGCAGLTASARGSPSRSRRGPLAVSAVPASRGPPPFLTSPPPCP